MSYYRLCTSLKDKGILIKEGVDLTKYKRGEAYISAYKYDEEHNELFKKNNSVAGFSGVTTDIIYFDIDNSDFSIAQKDTITIVERLKKYNIKNTVICFTSGKGFHLALHTVHIFSPKEAKTLAINLAGDLPSFDSTIYNDNRLIRIEGSVHNKTGLRKTRISEEELRTLSLADLRTLAKDEYKYVKPEKETLTEAFLKLSEPVNKDKKEDKVTITEGVDYFSNPYKLQPWKLAISQGFFPDGHRSNALMILAATLKNKNLLKEQCYYALKAAADLQADRYDSDKFGKEEIWDNIIKQVYSPTWQGGSYAEDNFDIQIQQYFEDLGVPRKEESDLVGTRYTPIKIGDVGASFEKFVLNYEKNVIKTGIAPLDRDIPITPGMNLGIIGAPGAGKCLGKDTPVRMYDGSIKMVQDIKKGELLMGDDSTARTVLGTCTGREKLYKIKQANGDAYIVNASHIISLKTNENKGHYQKGDKLDMNIEEFMSKNKQFKRTWKGYKVGVDYPKKEVSVDPYFMGLWLGDGSSYGTGIYNVDQPILDYIKDYAKEINLGFSQNKDPRTNVTTARITRKGESGNNPLLDRMRALGVIKKNKFDAGKLIPKDYLINDRETRLKLLAGLMDSDGHVKSKGTCYNIVQSNERLSRDILDLVRSLGFKGTLTKVSKAATNGSNIKSDYYSVYITGNSISDINKYIRLERKKVSGNPKTAVDQTRFEVEDLGEGDYYGFEIDGNHRFLLGDYTVTHNTALALKVLEHCSDNNIHCILASIDMHSTRLYEKILYRVSGLSREDLYDKFKNGEAEELKEKVRELFKTIYVYDKSAASIEDIAKYHKAIEAQEGVEIKMTMIDYFERVTSDVADDTASSKKVASQWQDYINDYNVAGIMFVQPSKAGLGGGPNAPILDYRAIKGSSFLYQSFRGIISLWRPFYTPDNALYDNYMQMALLKNDLGKLCTYDFGWDGKRGEISELDDDRKRILKMLLDEREDDEDI